MSGDIVARLRSRIPPYYCGPTMREAADAIEARAIASFKERFVAASAAAAAVDPTATSAEAIGEPHSNKTLATE